MQSVSDNSIVRRWFDEQSVCSSSGSHFSMINCEPNALVWVEDNQGYSLRRYCGRTVGKDPTILTSAYPFGRRQQQYVAATQVLATEICSEVRVREHCKGPWIDGDFRGETLNRTGVIVRADQRNIKIRWGAVAECLELKLPDVDTASVKSSTLLHELPMTVPLDMRKTALVCVYEEEEDSWWIGRKVGTMVEDPNNPCQPLVLSEDDLMGLEDAILQLQTDGHTVDVHKLEERRNRLGVVVAEHGSDRQHQVDWDDVPHRLKVTPITSFPQPPQAQAEDRFDTETSARECDDTTPLLGHQLAIVPPPKGNDEGPPIWWSQYTGATVSSFANQSTIVLKDFKPSVSEVSSSVQPTLSLERGHCEVAVVPCW
eukprot:TRINITY_DN61730_c0_g1_i2.p1 TRINITY_DN61730_c0_g1~~TRINITY_DN61730_c0_g1_i2.p1  ORF type:complete len:371 (-),score=21.94 TRINITY_DN61730_c0_g1_i2:274-1386(-)